MLSDTELLEFVENNDIFKLSEKYDKCLLIFKRLLNQIA
jgi:hypothetical protein